MSAVAVRARGVPFSVILLELLPAALLIALFAVVGILHVTSRVLVVKVGYELSRLDQDAQQLSREHDRLKLELATLKSPSHIEALARTQLSMAPPAPGTVIHLDKGH